MVCQIHIRCVSVFAVVLIVWGVLHVEYYTPRSKRLQVKRYTYTQIQLLHISSSIDLVFQLSRCTCKLSRVSYLWYVHSAVVPTTYSVHWSIEKSTTPYNMIIIHD